jgi:hypothetical protein
VLIDLGNIVHRDRDRIASDCYGVVRYRYEPKDPTIGLAVAGADVMER